MEYKLPRSIAHLPLETIRQMIRDGKADILPFRDSKGRAVVILT